MSEWQQGVKRLGGEARKALRALDEAIADGDLSGAMEAAETVEDLAARMLDYNNPAPVVARPAPQTEGETDE